MMKGYKAGEAINRRSLKVQNNKKRLYLSEKE